jgi:hypothetical protein
MGFFGRNNNNLSMTFDFDQAIRKVGKIPYWFSDDFNRNWSNTIIVGHDRSDMYVDIMRDGERTVTLGLPHLEQIYEVSINSLHLLLKERGFDVSNSVWYADGSGRRDNDEPGYIYIIQMAGSDLYKIGRTKNYKNRVDLLGVLMPKPCDFVGVWQTPRMKTSEAILHLDYAPFHSNGEWFEITNIPKLLRFMDEVHVRVK